MNRNVIDYFDSMIMPLIQDKHNNILKDANIMILGSVGLGIDDGFSDMEAVIYLPQQIWRKYGGKLQLDLNKKISETNLWKKEGSIICVHPLSWLLDGNGEKIMSNVENIPWNDISFESLFTIQENLIYYDSNDNLNKIKKITAESEMPEYIWKKEIIIRLKDTLECLNELYQFKNRNKYDEAQIPLGKIIEYFFQMGFLICHRYYPWRTHYSWAFKKLPQSFSKLCSDINLLSSTTEWKIKIEMIEKIIYEYKNNIAIKNIIPEIDIRKKELVEELIWAERLESWNNPNWKEFINKRIEKAIIEGYAEDQFWIWSLWGLDS